MQYYVNNKDKYGVFTDFLDGSMNGKEELFSKKGCKMTAGAKIASEITGSEIGLYEVNTVWDTDKDGLLTKDVHGSNHWVVLEGYKVNSDGSITFSYDGPSDNDADNNRSYVIDKSDADNNIHNTNIIIT